jgi:uncharacterized protein involved in exopolysaccharide biosynthesis
MLYLPQPDQATSYPQLELVPKILNIFFKWKWLILACMLAVVIPVAAITLLKPYSYQVTTKILVRSARANLAMNLSTSERAASINPMVTSPVTIQILNSEIQILKSEDLVAAAVAQSGYPLVGSDQPDTPVNRERSIQSLRTRMTFTPLPDSNVIEVSIQDASATNATKLLNTLSALYLRKHANLQTGGDSANDFFVQQVRFHRDRFERARKELEAFQERDNIVDIKQEMDNALQKIAAMEGLAKDAQTDIATTTKEIAALQDKLANLPEEVTKERTVLINPEVTAMRTKLIDLERQRDDLLSRYTPKSRFVADKENEIAILRKALSDRDQTVAGDMVLSQNAIRNQATQQLMQKQIALDALLAKRTSILNERKSYEARLDVLKDRSFDLYRLRGDFDMARETYFLYEKKAEEARVSKAMDEEKLVNAAVLQSASAPLLPLPRGVAIAGAVSGVGGIILGVVVAFLLEFFNVKIQDEKDIERFLQVPVLATVRQF